MARKTVGKYNNMVRADLRIYSWQDEKLDEISKNIGQSKNDIIRYAIIQYIDLMKKSGLVK